jgi:hypothetical protein
MPVTPDPTPAAEAPVSAASIVDNIGRALAVGMPRRRAIGFILKGLAAAALAQFGVRSAWAAATCICPATGALYDPVLACCTSSGVQNKNPIANLAACPDRTGHPGFVPIPNDCGSPGDLSHPFIPNSFGAANFLPCCQAHDICYLTCAPAASAAAAKATCDSTIGTCVPGKCDSAYPPGTGMANAIKNRSCHAVADRYGSAVSSFGQTAYDSGQMAACDCCATSACATSCASPGQCGGFSSCGQGGDCVCATLAEGGGTCGHGGTPCAGIQRCTATSQCPSGYSCWATSCCGGFGVCVPICNPVGPAPQSTQRAQSAVSGPTVAHP